MQNVADVQDTPPSPPWYSIGDGVRRTLQCVPFHRSLRLPLFELPTVMHSVRLTQVM
jgi:hypothetical protein